ncbi:MAG: glycosyltransferase [Candidatus Omnitrophota bacterium]
MKEYPFVSVITVNYNGRKHLKDYFDSLFALNYPNSKIEIIMVDNGSVDGSQGFVKENYPKVKILQNDVNNYCKANNLAIRQAKGDFIVLINNDTRADKDWLINLVEAMLRDERIAMAGSKILLMDGRIQNAGHIELPNFYWAERGFGEEASRYNKPEEVSSLCGAAVMFRREIFDKVGLLDEDFNIYFEDVDMAKRIKDEGFKVVFVPESMIYHAFHGTASDEFSQFYIERNRLFFVAKHYPKNLAGVLFGKGYFSCRKHLEHTGKIFQILPEVIFKLVKHNKNEDIKNILDEIFLELKKINNSESNFLIKEILAKEKNIKECIKSISEKDKEFVSLKTVLLQTKFQLEQRIKEVDLVRSALIETRETLSQKLKELNDIYSSEGFRFVLRPLWTLILSTRNFLNNSVKNISQPVCLLFALLLYPISFLLALIFLAEGILWRLVKLFSIKQIPPKPGRKTETGSKISVVIPSYNGLEYLKECLSSIYKTKEFKADFGNEILVVDDASCDETASYLRIYFPRVRIISNEKNLGFGKSCNIGIGQAKNEIIILLNNDIIVTEDSLGHLINHLKNKNTFAVSPRLYAWDRKTFINGNFFGDFNYGYIHIWNEKDVSATPYIQSPSSTMFAVGCAACFLKEEFLALGGFDNIFEPYSWEDIDISYRAQKMGFSVIYEPKSLMFHKMHGTIGSFSRSIEVKNELLFTWKNITDLDLVLKHFLLFPLYFSLKSEKKAMLRGYFMTLGSLTKALSRRFYNRSYYLKTDKEIFHNSQEIYQDFKYNDNQDISSKPTIMFITPFLPYPLKSGGQIKMYNSLKSLRDKYEIILVSFIENQDQERHIPELNKLCKKVFTVLRRPTWHSVFNKVTLPAFIKYFYAKEMAGLIKSCLNDYRIDLVQIEYANMAYYAKFIPNIPKILVEHDTSIYTLSNSYEKPAFGRIFRFFDWLNWVLFQKRIYLYFDKIVTFTEEDRKIARRAVSPDKISVIPIGIDLASYQLPKDINKSIDILFVGHMLHYPNVDGLLYFCDKIFPLIKSKMPGVNFHIIGSNMGSIDLEKIKDDKNIRIVGEVDDVRPYLARSKLLVSPIRKGAGLKVKILEALAMGIPVVATSQSVKGLKIEPEDPVYIGDTPGKFSDTVIGILNNGLSQNGLAEKARGVIDRFYDSKGISSQMELLYESLILHNDKIIEHSVI